MKTLINALFILGCTVAFAQSTTLNSKKAEVKFNYVSEETEGTFKDVIASIEFNPLDLSNSKVHGSAMVKSISTKNPARDNHLKTKTYFNVKKFPTIDFSSSELRKNDDGVYEAAGTLTIKGFKKPVVFNMEETNESFVFKTSIYAYDYGIAIKKERELSIVEVEVVLPKK